MRLFLATPFYVLVVAFAFIGMVSNIMYDISVALMLWVGGGQIERGK